MERLIHRLHPARSLTRVAVIGCGGTGACLLSGLPFLHQALVAMGHPGLRVVVADGDRVSPTNCVRQPFSESEVGLYKSVVLVNRLNLFWGLRWEASTEYVSSRTDAETDIIISCVDSRSARCELLESPLLKKCAYWLDIGNNAESGQFVLGQPKNDRNRRTRARLRTVAELFPEITISVLDTNDDLPSCSAVEALERQEPFINQTLAYHALAMLARLLRHGELTHQGGFINLATGIMAPLSLTPLPAMNKKMEDAAIAHRKTEPRATAVH